MKKYAAVLAPLAVLLAASCGSVPKTSYYTLRASPPPGPAAADPKTTFSLGIEHFHAAEVLRDSRIVYYRSPTALDFYNYHRWSSDPATMLTERVARGLRYLGLFSLITHMPAREPVDYTLRGRVFSFEEVDFEGQGKGRVALQLELVRVRDRHLVWSETRQAEHAAEGKGVDGVVTAVNASTEEVLSQLITGLSEQVQREFAESQKK